MAFKIKKSGVWVDPTVVRRRSGGAWVTPQTIKRRVSGAWVTVWSALTLTKTSEPENTMFANEPAPFSQTLTAYPGYTVTGGTSYTYSWVRLTSGQGIAISSTTAAVPSFTATLFKNSTAGETWRLTVTDTASGQSKTLDFNVYLAYWTDL